MSNLLYCDRLESVRHRWYASGAATAFQALGLELAMPMMIGVALAAERFNFHVPKGYIYFAMAFSVAVEMLNIKLRKKLAQPVKLRKEME